MTNLTARTKGTLVSWDQWRSAQAELQGRKKPKPAMTTAEKYVRNNKLTPFVTRTNGNGSFFAISLETGEEVQFKIVITNSGGRVKYYHSGMAAGEHNVALYAINGVDIELQRKLIEKFHDKNWYDCNYLTVDAIRYCNDNPEFSERLLSEDTHSNLFAPHSYEGFFYSLRFETLANNHSLLFNQKHRIDSFTPVEVLGCPYEVSVWCERYIDYRLRKYIPYTNHRYITAGPLVKLVYRMHYMQTLINVVDRIKAMVNRGYFTLDYLRHKYPDV